MHFSFLFLLLGMLLSSASCCPDACDCRKEVIDPPETTPLVPPPTSNSMREAGREARSTTPAEPLQTNSCHPSTTTQVPQTFAEQHPQEGSSSTELWPQEASTSTELRPQESSPISNSPAFYDAVILEPEDHIVHHNRRDGWVYLWTLPPSGPYLTFLGVLHIGLVATGMALIVASACLLCRLNQAMEQAAHEPMQEGNRTKSGRRQRFSDKL
ncbi:hypothetical protein GJAV_G00072230 [Gymnothorax javanicus]|nr:hypothetical protein GJAV_G00072230 [Gymnothorax javanicus]